MPFLRFRATPLALALALSSFGLTTLPAHAQTGAAIPISVPAQPLGTALNELARQARLQLMVHPDLVAGKQAPAVSGQLTPAQALDRLLAGSGLQANINGAEVIVREASADASASTNALPATALPPVRVTAPAVRPGDLPEPYAGGQQARGARAGLLGNKDFMETPFSITGYTNERIADTQTRDLLGLVGNTDPAVFTSGTNNTQALGTAQGAVTIRGFGNRMDIVAVNGVYGISMFNRGLIDFAERIEVHKGPSAMLGGMPTDGSVGGSINIVTKRPTDQPLTRLTTSYASRSMWGLHADISRRFGEQDRFGIRVNAAYRDGNTEIKQQKKKDQTLALAMDWRGNGLRLYADLFSTRLNQDGIDYSVGLLGPGMTTVPRVPDPRRLITPDYSFMNTKEEGAILRAEADINPDFTVYGSLARSRSHYDSLQSHPLSVTLDMAGTYRTNLSYSNQTYNKTIGELGGRLNFRTGSVGHELAFAGNYFKSNAALGFVHNLLAGHSSGWYVTNIYDPVWPAQEDSSYRQLRFPRSAGGTRTSLGLADTLKFMDDRLQLTLGLRRQNVKTETVSTIAGAAASHYSASATTPAFAALYKLNEQISLYGNYIEGLSPGRSAPATAANAGEIFAPYKTKQKEIGLKLDAGNFAHTFSLYEITRPEAYLNPHTNEFSFGGAQRNRGLEWSFFGEPLKGLRAMGGIGYVQAKVTRPTTAAPVAGKLAVAVPAWQAKLAVEWDVPAVHGLSLSADVMAASKQYVDAANTMSVSGRAIYGLGARYRTSALGKPLTLRANVINLFDKAYWASGRLYEGPGIPRTFLLSASMDF